MLSLSSNILYARSYFHSGLLNVSGEATFSFSNSEEEYLGNISQKEITILPAVSYFILDKLSVGIEFSYNYYEKSYDIFDKKDIEMFIGFGPVVKY